MQKFYWGVALFILLVVVGLAIYYFFLSTRENNTGTVYIGEHKFMVEVSDNTLSRSQGLSGKEKLTDDEGMLFIFDKPAVQRFWMKGMLIPIDIIWIEGGRVIGFEKNIGPEAGVSLQNLSVYSSPVPVGIVLEVSAGTVDRLSIKNGDAVSISL